MKIKIGTRGSTLALIQTEIAEKLLREYATQNAIELDIIIIPIVTSGDKFMNNLSEIGGKELFTKEIEDALIKHDIDIAIHSMKDIPAKISEKTILGAFLKREMPNDVLISEKYNNLDEMPKKSKIGTSSIRRKMQLLQHKTFPIRGNVDSRLKKYKNEGLDAIILAYAGLKRIDAENAIKQIIPFDQMIPSVGQGVIAIQVLKENHVMMDIIENLNHYETKFCCDTERSFIEKINGNCRTPVGGVAIIDANNEINFTTMIATRKGIFYASDRASINDARELGESLAEKLMKDSEFSVFHY